MKKIMKLSGLMMSALLCMFTSCTSNDEKKQEPVSGPSTVEVTVYMGSETLNVVEGSFVVQSMPSGQKSEINVNNIIFAFDATSAADKAYTTVFTSKAKKATLKIVCDASEKEVTITPNLKVKSGIQLSDDVKYTYEVTGVITQNYGLGRTNTDDNTFTNTAKGSKFEEVVRNNNTSLLTLKLLK
ncbi:MAG: hypothetical protein MJZ36_10005 [Bacteroidaceae bacterium]|nr:hypothetical protein [Bacteroidaceae bacterium]